MRLLLILILLAIPALTHAWGPMQATSFKKVKGMDWAWSMNTTKADEVLRLDCQSFIHQFQHFKQGQESLNIMLREEECQATHASLRKCFPIPGKACVKGTILPEVSCGTCHDSLF